MSGTFKINCICKRKGESDSAYGEVSPQEVGAWAVLEGILDMHIAELPHNRPMYSLHGYLNPMGWIFHFLISKVTAAHLRLKFIVSSEDGAGLARNAPVVSIRPIDTMFARRKQMSELVKVVHPRTRRG